MRFRLYALDAALPAALTLMAALATPAMAGLNVKLKAADGIDPTSVFFQFRNGPSQSIDATYNGGVIQKNFSYSLCELSAGVTINNFVGGVVYVSRGKALANGGPDPSPFNPTDPDYLTRWDNFELGYDGGDGNVADLTSINKFAIPIQLSTFSGGGTVAQQTAGFALTTDAIINKLGPQSGGNAILKDGENFLRLLGPTSYGDLQGDYPSFDKYYNSVVGQSVSIQDVYSRDGDTPPTETQNYNFTAALGADGITLTGGGDKIGQGHTIVIPKVSGGDPGNLLKKGFYGANPQYTVDGAPASFNDNDVYSAAVRDVLAGFAIGYVGSDVIDPKTGLKFKEETSRKWFSQDADSQLAFSDVQPGKGTSADAYFNAYGEVFWRDTDSYGFPFSDRLQKRVQVNIVKNNGVSIDALEVTILADGGAGSGTAAPEPATLCYAAVGLLGYGALGATRRRRAGGRA